MTATQSFKIYEILQRHFKNNDDAKVVVQEIEQIVEAKVDEKVNILSTREDLLKVKEELKEDLLRFQIDVEKRFNNSILWTVGTGVGIVGMIFSIIKLFLIK
jgi:hypothetical protein